MGGTEALDTELYLARFRALAIFLVASSLDTPRTDVPSRLRIHWMLPLTRPPNSCAKKGRGFGRAQVYVSKSNY
jgi:hypothetical protein